MDALRVARKAARTESAREIGTNYGLPKVVSDQSQVAFMIGELASFPTVAVPSPIITDPADPHFGKFRFILGISRLGGPDVMG